MTSKATGVRKVTSKAGKPPATKACASGLAVAKVLTTNTGMTAANWQISLAVLLII
jgi:hypothetical protein